MRQLADGESFTIPAGQFALLLTEEIVEVPNDTLAFISIRAKTKFKGLVNVSGFHVDPGFKGQLTFAVFNAGPSIIHLKRGQEIFVIWYASLDRVSSSIKRDGVRLGIDPEIIQGISGELESFASLAEKIKSVDKDLGDRVHAVEKEQSFYRAVALWAVPLLIAVAVIATNWVVKEEPKNQTIKADVNVTSALSGNEAADSSSNQTDPVQLQQAKARR